MLFKTTGKEDMNKDRSSQVGENRKMYSRYTMPQLENAEDLI